LLNTVLGRPRQKVQWKDVAEGFGGCDDNVMCEVKFDSRILIFFNQLVEMRKKSSGVIAPRSGGGVACYKALNKTEQLLWLLQERVSR
jgi:hypothetical protein